MLQACDGLLDEDDDENETKISSYNSSESHNEGKDCMSCHTPSGEGEGRFTAAGTVYDSLSTSTFPGATVRLYSDPGGTGEPAAVIQVDKLGNFYTTEKIDFNEGLYASAEGKEAEKMMSMPVTTGACNSCHGVKVSKIWTK